MSDPFGIHSSIVEVREASSDGPLLGYSHIATATCAACVYGQKIPEWVAGLGYDEGRDLICNRFPKFENRTTTEWCGEFKKRYEVAR